MKKILFIIFVLVFLYLLQNFILYNHKKQSVIFYKNGAVVTAHPEATQVGLDVLKAGGNAFDAAIAVQFSLSVVYQQIERKLVKERQDLIKGSFLSSFISKNQIRVNYEALGL